MKRLKRNIDRCWNKEEQNLLRRLSSPQAIQAFLDRVDYSTDLFYRTPRDVLRDRRAHCTDGALFAAAALRQLGYPPIIIELRAVRDDDHLLAIFRRDGLFGAVAKSNFVTLRYREPVYRSLRELVMSYFDGFYNVNGERTMRAYSALFPLARFDHLNWMTEQAGLDHIIDCLDRSRHYPIAPPAVIRRLIRVDERSYQAGLMGAKPEGLYQP